MDLSLATCLGALYVIVDALYQSHIHGARTRDLRILFRGFSRSVCVVSISRSSGLKADF